MADADFDRLDNYYGEVKKILATEDEYMPDKWDYNEWYHGNNWEGMSRADRESSIRNSPFRSELTKYADYDWLDIPEADRKKLNYVGTPSYFQEARASERDDPSMYDPWGYDFDGFDKDGFSSGYPKHDPLLRILHKNGTPWDNDAMNRMDRHMQNAEDEVYDYVKSNPNSTVADILYGLGWQNGTSGTTHIEDAERKGHIRKTSSGYTAESYAKEISRPITDKEAMLMYDKPWDELTQEEKMEMHRILADESRANEDYIPAPYDQHFEWVASMDQDDYRCKHCGKWMYWDSPQGLNALHTAPVHEIIPIVRDHLETHGITESYAKEDWSQYNHEDLYPSDPAGDAWRDEGTLSQANYDMSVQDMNRLYVDTMKDHLNYAMNQSNFNWNYYEDLLNGWSPNTAMFDLPHSKGNTPEAQQAFQQAHQEVKNWFRDQKQSVNATYPSPSWESITNELTGGSYE